MSKAEEHHRLPPDNGLSDRVYERMEGEGEEERGVKRVEERGEPTGDNPAGLFAAPLVSRESRKVQNDIAPDRHVPFDKSVGS